MKKTIFLITTAFGLFNFSPAIAQAQDLDTAINTLSGTILSNKKKLNDTLVDLNAIVKSINVGTAQFSATTAIFDDNRTALLVHEYLFPVFMLSHWTKEDDIINYFSVLLHYLKMSRKNLNIHEKNIEKMYPHLKNKAALHSADKVKKILRDSLSQIDPVLIMLSKSTGIDL